VVTVDTWQDVSVYDIYCGTISPADTSALVLAVGEIIASAHRLEPLAGRFQAAVNATALRGDISVYDRDPDACKEFADAVGELLSLIRHPF